MCSLHFLDLLQSSAVALAAVEAGGEEGAHELARELDAHDLTTQAEHVHVVVLDALVRGVRVVADSRSDAGELARGNRGSDARAADEHAALGLAGADRLAELACLVGVVDADAPVVGS